MQTKRKRKELGNMALLDKVFWSSQIKTKLVNSNQRSRLFPWVGGGGDIIKGLHKVNALGSRGDC